MCSLTILTSTLGPQPGYVTVSVSLKDDLGTLVATQTMTVEIDDQGLDQLWKYLQENSPTKGIPLWARPGTVLSE